MKFNLFEPGKLAYYMGKLYRIIWSTRHSVHLQLIGTYGMGMTMIDGTANSLAWNQRTVSAKHWSLYLAPTGEGEN